MSSDIFNHISYIMYPLRRELMPTLSTHFQGKGLGHQMRVSGHLSCNCSETPLIGMANTVPGGASSGTVTVTCRVEQRKKNQQLDWCQSQTKRETI